MKNIIITGAQPEDHLNIDDPPNREQIKMSKYICKCGASRWKTVNKSLAMYRCRNCGRLYKDGNEYKNDKKGVNYVNTKRRL